MKADTICCYCHKQAHDKRGIEESLHAQMTRARLTMCEVGVFSRESKCSHTDSVSPSWPSLAAEGAMHE